MAFPGRVAVPYASAAQSHFFPPMCRLGWTMFRDAAETDAQLMRSIHSRLLISEQKINRDAPCSEPHSAVYVHLHLLQ